MKLYFKIVALLLLLLNHTRADHVWVTAPDRFYDSSQLVCACLTEEALPSVTVEDPCYEGLSEGLLTTSPACSLRWCRTGEELTTVERTKLNETIGAFGTVRFVQNMWQQTLNSFPKVCPVSGCTPMCTAVASWSEQPALKLKTHADCLTECALNAYYDSSTHRIVLPRFIQNGAFGHTTTSFDVTAHEAGHAMLTAFCPRLNVKTVHSAALHESFGDVTALFASLHLASRSQQIKWLNESSVDACIAGDITSGMCIRNIADESTISCEAHSLSVPFTRFVCQYVKTLWRKAGDDAKPSDVLKTAQQNLVAGILETQDEDNILTALLNYFHTSVHKVNSTYLEELTSTFATCSL